MELAKLLNFIEEADKLKKVQRATLTYHENRLENSAEHSWHLALAVLTYGSNHPEKLDLLKCIKMALIHDLVEIDAGDTIVYADDPNKYERELAAAKKIFSLLPEKLGDELLQIWVEFEHKETAEAIFVGGLDRFLPLNSNLIQKGNSWIPHGITKEQVHYKNQKAIEAGIPGLWNDIKGKIDDVFIDITKNR
jgi:putative hydrolase of HD superfamily